MDISLISATLLVAVPLIAIGLPTRDVLTHLRVRIGSGVLA